MKKINAGSMLKLGAALLIATLLICAVGIAANGWRKENVPINETENKEKTNSAPNDSSLEQENEPTQKQQNVTIPEYENMLTGSACSKSAAEAAPFCFVTDPSAPLYGVSSADLVIEVPTENGETRLLTFESDLSSLGKIGALSKTRAYLETLARFFGGIPVSYGRDDLVSYTSLPVSSSLDLAASGYCYMENIRYVFTSGESVASAAAGLAIPTEARKNVTLPYTFCEYASTPVSGTGRADSVILPYGENTYTTLSYSRDTGRYALLKGGKVKNDLLTGRVCEFENVFVLFADTVLYGKASGTESVTDTISGGTGYYISEGTMTEIRWSVDDNGMMLFQNLLGEKLTINRGQSYIGFYPSCSSYDVTIE